MRSPLLAVDSFFRLVEKKLDESERYFGRIAIRRLDDIAWSLLSKFKNKNINEDENNYVFLHSCIQEILSEKRMEYAKQNIEFEFMVSPGDAFTLVYLNSINLKRMLSNIINNAVNAIMPKTGLVEICLEVNFAGALISIKDNGKGMSPEFIKEIFANCRMEKAKTNLGLPHAIEFVDQVDGKLEIISNEGKGTTVNISLPPCDTPFWCISEYHALSDELLIFIDDSKAVHDVWDDMLRNFKDLNPKHFYNAQDALSFMVAEQKKLVIFCDYEFFDEDKNGLYILDKAPKDATKILVTSCLYNQKIMKEAIERGFKILPKDLVPYFKIRKKVQTSEKQISLIFIDDEPRNTQSWEFFAKTKKLKIVTYNDIHAFLVDANNFEKDIPIYIDLDLQSERSGIDYAKDIHKKGFHKIYITTGAIDFEIENAKYPWITEIQEKRFPFI